MYIRKGLMPLELEKALQEAHLAEGEPHVGSPIDRPLFGADSVSQTVTWKSRLFGTVTIELQVFTMGTPEQLDRFTMVVPLFLDERKPGVINFLLNKELAEGVRLYHAKNGPATDCTEGRIPQFRIQANWTESGWRSVPRTVSKNEDDIDLVFLDTKGSEDGRKGAFVQLEISLSTRRGLFFLTIQQVYAGQIVRTTAANAEKTSLQTVKCKDGLVSVVPLYPENAFPGSDYIKNFGYMAPSFLQFANEHGASVPLSKCVIARWEPIAKEMPLEMKNNGWQMATTKWFNDCLGWGFLHCADGQACFVHFKQIEDPAGEPYWKMGAFPHLTPMHHVAVKYETAPDGKRKAVAVRVL